ncbi:SDR family oxidoreductase [Frankia sp. CNm7]|uniref:SDR family oxidoreductase n=1 Tax=Frankia nepalensis TaxID=1836974 RepID=A0A937RTG6_9ACTN|nr:SDR family oxidoreductase [Frankia nepalensis]MBL7500186.1 SDR family oxidoreductase [Frankia nepalensis]MBL7509434.1 SDR family oxidoreductase [Frankia nepalensis]MBL7524808.1 SDR family oxidoreductase [Frankia nepalensis]MBL7631616.1 SDR family oxidoreductase [Frankia nepalensis]
MKVAVVGASSGLGRCIGVDLGQRGDQVALLARRRERLVDAAKEAGPGTLAIACDVTDEASAAAAVEEAVAGLGGLDALVYCAGIGPLSPVEKVDAATWRRAFDTNVTGAALVTAAALPHLKAAGGVAAYLSSISASHTPVWPGFAAYAVSKAALDKLVEAYRTEHPEVGFTRVVVGDCAGGDGYGRTEFANDWDLAYAAKYHPIWHRLGYATGALLDVAELARVVDSVLRCRGTVPSVTVMPRQPA